jgi:hypothetical protein
MTTFVELKAAGYCEQRVIVVRIHGSVRKELHAGQTVQDSQARKKEGSRGVWVAINSR